MLCTKYAVLCFVLLQQAYQPKRKYKKPGSATEADEETQVSMTLLEYGRYDKQATFISTGACVAWRVKSQKIALKKDCFKIIGIKEIFR